MDFTVDGTTLSAPQTPLQPVDGKGTGYPLRGPACGSTEVLPLATPKSLPVLQVGDINGVTQPPAWRISADTRGVHIGEEGHGTLWNPALQARIPSGGSSEDWSTTNWISRVLEEEASHTTKDAISTSVASYAPAGLPGGAVWFCFSQEAHVRDAWQRKPHAPDGDHGHFITHYVPPFSLAF